MFLDNQNRRVKVAVGTSSVILILREPTTEEYTHFIGMVSHPTRNASQQEKVVEKRIQFIDKLLIGIDAEDSEGNQEEIFVPRESGKAKLTAELEGWKECIRPDWKLAASFNIEGKFLAVEQETLKN